MARKLTQQALAKALGVSQGMISRHKAQGMPTDSIEAARQWRLKNLDPSYIKGVRMPGW